MVGNETPEERDEREASLMDTVLPMDVAEDRRRERMLKRAGCSPKLLAAIMASAVLLALVFFLGAVLFSGDKKKEEEEEATTSASPATPSPGEVRHEGSSGGPVGCVPCDGQYRHLAITNPPGPGSFPGDGGKTSAQVALGPGTVRDLKVQVDKPDRGRWQVFLIGSDMFCVLQPQQTSCQSTGTFELKEQTMVAIGIGNDGDKNIYANNPSGRPVVNLDTDGTFALTFSFTFVPA